MDNHYTIKRRAVPLPYDDAPAAPASGEGAAPAQAAPPFELYDHQRAALEHLSRATIGRPF